MNLSEQGNMFTGTSVGENLGGIKEEFSEIDLHLDNGKLPVSLSPTPYQWSSVAAYGSSISTVESDVSGLDFLSAFNPICIDECLEPRYGVAPDIRTDPFDSLGQVVLSRQQSDEGRDTSKFDFSDSTIIAKPPAQMDGKAEVLVGTDKTCTESDSLIVYTPSRRRSARNSKSNQNNKPRKPSKCRRIANKNSVFDLCSMQILRRSRSSLAKRARSSVWGNLGNILPGIAETSGPDLNLGNEKKPRKGKGGKGKRKIIKDQTGRRSLGKSCPPIGHISLKVKIGNISCSMVNAVENSGKDIPVLTDTLRNELVQEVPRDVLSACERNLEKVMSSDASLSTHLEVRSTVENQSLDTSSDFHETRSLETGINLGDLTEIRCSDAGTSPDSEVINSVPDASLCQKGLHDLQYSQIMSKACVSPTDILNLILSPKHSKKGKKKGKLHQVDNCMLESKLTSLESRDNAKAPASTQDGSSLSSSRSKSKKGKKKDKLSEVGDSSVENNLTGEETKHNANAPMDLGVGQKVGDVSYCSYTSMYVTAKPYLQSAEMEPCSGLVAASVSLNSEVSNGLIHCSNGRKFPKCSGAKGGSKGRSRILPKEKDKASKMKGNKNNVDRKHLVDEKVAAGGDRNTMESLLRAGNQTPSDLGATGSLSNGLSGPINSLQFSSDGVREQYEPPRNAWVLCDECQKWRRIPAALADQIEETDCGWTCRDNIDEDFADCSIPQEKSNSEINEELEISDASCEEDASGNLFKSNEDRSKAAQQSSWTLIKSNLFLHRSRKTQTIDEIMVCHCKPPSDGRMGCGAKCLNRMLNIECVQGTCPCGERCSNQQFQKRKYTKLKWVRCGKKGYGLQALHDMSEGKFLIEYVGEVLDMQAYEARQREYALNGHRHFYFMTLNGSEVIDACAKGNLGRFINHSCDPNCRTEKWMVNGEVCIGLFALRDIKKGEEVTFDYNFVRVVGAAAKKCVCGSRNCRGYIGGDLTNSEVIAQDDSDDEYAEPVMICEDGEMSKEWNEIMSNTSSNGENELANEPPQNIYNTKKLINAVGGSIAASHTSDTQKFEGVNSAPVAETRAGDGFDVYNSVGNNSAANVLEKLNTNNITGESLKGSMPAAVVVESEGLRSEMHLSSQHMDNSLKSDGIVNKAMSSAHEPVIDVAPSKSLSDTVEQKKKLKYATVRRRDEVAKSNSLAKTNHSFSSIKKGKPQMNVMNDIGSPDVDKLSAALQKSKKLPELSLNSHFEAVEEKLNELLDPEGGISKRKDASRGYLKLLFLTAATGNNGHGEAIQSNRDLSMILDALLKTKSRTVLVDIINKNGLQMLHNIMKRYRKEFIKTPILRKLLKVLEYLATREILTLEHITGGPPCPGVESFKDSILTMTEHADKQVHQTARNFRDKWIPRSFRKNCRVERDDGRIEFHQPSSHGGLSVSYDHWSDRDRKPSEVMNSFQTQSIAAAATSDTSTLVLSASGNSCATNDRKTRKRKSRWDNPEQYPNSKTRTDFTGDEKVNVDEDIPPGFSSPCNGHVVPADAVNNQEREMRIKQHHFNNILGDPQLRFVARMPVAYGVPNSVMRQFGVQAETSERWTVAPGVPFHPFPPLPPCTSGEVDQSTSAARCASSSEPTEKAGQSSDTCVTCENDQRHTKTCSTDLPEKSVLVSNGRPDSQQGGSCSLGRKYFRQQKWNHSKLAPPWVRMRNGWGHPGNNPRNGLPGVGLANGANDFRNSYHSDEVYRREF